LVLSVRKRKKEAAKENVGRFGAKLRAARLAAGKSMSQVARAIGVTTVYYSEVEFGRKRPFSPVNIDFARLATELETDRRVLQQLAANERGTVELRLDGTAPRVRRLALLLGSKLAEGELTDEEVQRLESVLAEDEDEHER
jgi:transcriptional regulator with XRE-family HTH domain